MPNPPFHPKGDFGLDAQGHGLADGAGPDGRTWTYANLALMRGALVAGIAPGTQVAARAAAVRRHAPSAASPPRSTRGAWENVGTPAQLDALNR